MKKIKNKVFCKDCFYCNETGVNTSFATFRNDCLAFPKKRFHSYCGEIIEYPSCEEVNKKCNCKKFKPQNLKSKWRNYWNP